MTTAIKGGRTVCVTAEQAQILEEVGTEMMRRQDDRAMKLLALSLEYKFARVVETPDDEWHGLHVIRGGRDDA